MKKAFGTLTAVVCLAMAVAITMSVKESSAGTPTAKRKFSRLSVSGGYVNPLQLALNYTYTANHDATFSGAPYTFNGPQGIVFDGSSIWVSSYNGGKVTKLRASDGSFVASYKGGNTLTNPFCLGFDGQFIWVANHTIARVTKLRASNGTVAAQINVGNHPDCFAFDGTNMWVANGADGTVSKVTNNVVSCTTTVLGNQAVALVFDGTNIWVTVPFENHLVKLDLSCNVLNTYTIGNKPNGMAFDVLDGTLWVANNADNQVVEVDMSTGAVVKTVNVGTGPCCVSYDGANVWVSNFGAGSGNTVTKVQAGTGAILDTITVGTAPTFQVFDGANVWVANFGSNSVSKM